MPKHVRVVAETTLERERYRRIVFALRLDEYDRPIHEPAFGCWGGLGAVEFKPFRLLPNGVIDAGDGVPDPDRYATTTILSRHIRIGEFFGSDEQHEGLRSWTYRIIQVDPA